MKKYKQKIGQLIEEVINHGFDNHFLEADKVKKIMEGVIKNLTAKNKTQQMELDESNRLNIILEDKSASAVEIKSLTHINFRLKLRILELEATIRINDVDECTCNEGDSDFHTCPLRSEILLDKSTCSCCAYCESNCRDSI